MANYIAVTLFDQPEHARDGMRALKDKGYDSSDLTHIEADPESQNFFKRVFNREGGEELEAQQAMDYLTGLGIDEDDADDYATKVKKGRSLVIARCDSKSEAERARRILDEEPFGEDTATPRTEHRTTTTTDEPEGAGRPKQPGFDEPVAGVETGGEAGEPMSGTETGPATGSAGSEPGEYGADSPDIGTDERTTASGSDISVGDVSPDTAVGFSNYETDFRRHYENNLSETNLEFDDYTRGYRYGMALAEDETLMDYDFETIEPEAGRQWNSSETTNWDNVREAVRYAWYKVRGREDEYEQRYPGSR